MGGRGIESVCKKKSVMMGPMMLASEEGREATLWSERVKDENSPKDWKQ